MSKTIQEELRGNADCHAVDVCIDAGRLEDVQKRAADYIDELEATVARLPKTKDGKPIVEGDTIYWVVQEDPDYCGAEIGTPLSFEVRWTSKGVDFHEYSGTHTVCCDDIEFGNLDCYASFEEAEKAGKEMLAIYDNMDYPGMEEQKDPAGS